jgi:hypothetical protein
VGNPSNFFYPARDPNVHVSIGEKALYLPDLSKNGQYLVKLSHLNAWSPEIVCTVTCQHMKRDMPRVFVEMSE